MTINPDGRRYSEGDYALPCFASSPVSRSRPKAAAAIARKRNNGASAVRRRLARRVEMAFFDQHGMVVTCDPTAISFPKGFYRTNIHADTYRWSAPCRVNGTNVGPSVDSYDTATDCARFGILIDRQPYNRGWEATADKDAELLRDANANYSSVQLAEIASAKAGDER